jgi:ERCC4-type nuclease
MKNKLKNNLKNLFSLFFLVAIMSACSNKTVIKIEQIALKERAASINSDFKIIRLDIEVLASELTKLYQKQAQILPNIYTKKYQLASNGVFTKPIDDGGSAIMAKRTTQPHSYGYANARTRWS